MTASPGVLEHVDPKALVPGDNVRGSLGNLTDLVASIKAQGVIEPLIVRRVLNPDGVEVLELVAGHRRQAAAVKAKVTTVPVVVQDLDDDARDSIMLIENLMRLDINPVEEARGLFRLVGRGMTPKDVAKRIGRSVDHVTGRLALLELPDKALDLVSKGTVSLADAVHLLAGQKKGLGEGTLLDLASRGGDLKWRVEQEVEAAALAAKVGAARARLAKKGVPALETDSWQEPPGKSVRSLGLDDKAHAKEPCHAVWLYTSGRSFFDERAWCTDPKRHAATRKGKDASDLKVPPSANALAETEKERRAADRAAKQVARDRALSFAQAAKQTELNEIACLYTLASLKTDSARWIGGVLGLEAEKNPSRGNMRDWTQAVIDYAGRGATERRQVLAAVVAFKVYEEGWGLERTWGDPMKRLVRRRTTDLLGPDPSEVTAAWNEAHAEEKRRAQRDVPHAFVRVFGSQECATCGLTSDTVAHAGHEVTNAEEVFDEAGEVRPHVPVPSDEGEWCDVCGDEFDDPIHVESMQELGEDPDADFPARPIEDVHLPDSDVEPAVEWATPPVAAVAAEDVA